MIAMSYFAGKRHGDEIREDKSKRTRVYSDQNKVIPEGWLDCPPFGQEVECMIPSKVPLSESYNEYLPRDKTYTIKHLLYNNGHGRKRLALVIDLTNTTRYYHPQTELMQYDIGYVKIRCSGRDAVPDNVSVNTFVNEINKFKNSNGSDKYVLVHCTHGHNRTGFMIVHYLMRYRPMMTVTKALKTFSDARPPGIYKQEYIDALYSFYHEIKPDGLVCPTTPEWKRSDNSNREAVAPGCLAVQGIEKEEENVKMMSNDDILGDEIPYNQELYYQNIFYDKLKINGDRRSMYFPGAHPVSLDREQLQLLRQRYYYATWKADGTRYMMLLTREGCYLVDRKFRFRRVQMRFPCSDSQRVHHSTILDGEMVVDTLPNGDQVRNYLVYDLVAVNGESVIELPFRERLKLIDRAVIKPRNDEKKVRSHWYRYKMEPFGIKAKAFCVLSAIEKKLLKELIPSLPHEADGLIFQGCDDPYVPQRNNELLKWKYPDQNSVDYLFEMTKDGRGLLFLYECGRMKLMEGYSIEFRGDGWSYPASYSGKIVECSYDREKKLWVGMRIRVDKDKPNGINTALSVIKSINDNITEEVLVQEIKEIIRLPMYTQRIQMDSQAAGQRRHGNRKT